MSRGRRRNAPGVKRHLATPNGDTLAAGELGLTQRELHPNLYPSAPVVGKTREQVRADNLAAIRDGDMLAPGQSGPTEYELEPRFYALQRAIDTVLTILG